MDLWYYIRMATNTVKRAYKFRFYPDEQQRELLLRTFGCVRLVYNKALEERTQAWRVEGRSVNYAATSALLTHWKKTEELEFLNEVSSVPLQQALRHLHMGFRRFWSKQNGYPRFKSRKKSRKSAEFTASAFRWDPQLRDLRLAKMDNPLAVVWSRDIPEGSIPSTVTVSLDASGRWHVVLLTETKVERLPQSDSAVGVDLGVSDLAVLSTGEKVKAPRYSSAEANRLARAQRSAARKQPGSANRAKANRKVARIHAGIADRRRDHLHKLSTRLIRENQTVVLEDLSVAAMSRHGGAYKKGLNRAIADASMAELRSMIEYKAQWYGREVITIDRYFPSTRMCSACAGLTGPSGFQGLSVRQWECSGCGATHDRDVNAAKNIKAAGLAASVCGDGRSLRHSS